MNEANIIQSIIDFVINFKVMGVLLISFVIIAYILVNTKIGEYLIEKYFKKKENNVVVLEVNESKYVKIDINDSSILNHNFFSYIDLWVLNKVPALEFSTEFRTAVFRKYLRIYLYAYKNNFKSYLEKKEYEKLDTNELWKSILSLINNIVKEYESESIMAGIPLIVIEKMKQRNANHINLTIDLLDGICNTGYYNSEKNRLIIISILDIILTLLDNTISNSVDVCNSINGQLSNLKFEGYIEPEHK